ncbi:hypothetical protein GQF61_07365 [Sphingobacterium sp. DK4209]|uniref:BACON domain-containing protein n=1 Tax=Sphingobacterium zhuxiongii TaxID=2662364 RepID=A0A5Q0QIT6_9SPHI|nr:MULTISPECIES: BACON domain-containing protein [unclassified Sphingobacterium]MVZ65672.1 hypothetical protein [Sphingobacterium sp. DK4209]QGA27872.1 hypothetical protein GFH32_16755 [Sphingobacterium sp. dk4302]
MKSQIMQILNRNKSFYLIVLLCAIFFSSCEKDQHVKPQVGTFDLVHEIPASIPAAGGSYALTIDATTNAFWIEAAAEANWVTISRKYGSAKVTQQVIVAKNNTSAERTATVLVKSTNGESVSLVFKQQK